MAYNTRAPARMRPLTHPTDEIDDRDRHDRSTGSAKNRFHRGGADPVFSRVLDAAGQDRRAVRIPMEWEHAEVGHVGQYVEQRDSPGAEDQRERQVAPRVLHLGGSKGHVVPGVRRKERADEASPEREDKGRGQRADPDEVSRR